MTKKTSTKLQTPVGQQDPWRRRRSVNPGSPAPGDDTEHVIGTSSSEHPLDRDLMPIHNFPLRAPGQDYTLVVSGIEVNDPQTAVAVLLRAAQNPAVDLVLRRANFEHATVAEAQSRARGFVLRTTERVLWHAQSHSTAEGFRHLVRSLLAECRQDRSFRQRLEELGLRPLLP
jgi:hypothetical protein